MPSHEQIAPVALTIPAFHAWVADALAASQGTYVALAVGGSTLPLYGGLPPEALAGRRILPIDELVPAPARAEATFTARLRAALPPDLAPAVDAFPATDDPDEWDALERRIAAGGLALIVLGLGPDGHVAFNQPGSPPASRTRAVDLAPENLARLDGVDPADHAITMGLATIMGAASVALVVGGAGKEAALTRVLHGPAAPDVPASLLRSHPRLTVFVDP